MTPRRRTAILAALSLGTVATLGPGAYLGYQATIGGYTSDESCFVDPTTRPHNPAAHALGWGELRRWTWWRPRYHVKCVYDLPGGRTLIRPAPAS